MKRLERIAISCRRLLSRGNEFERKRLAGVIRSSFVDAPRLITGRLVLRGHRASDVSASFSMWSDEDVVRFIGGVPSTPADAWGRLLRYGGLWRLLGYGYWAVEDRRTGKFIGEVGFADFKRGVGEEFAALPEAGWVMAPESAGQGYATEAMRAALEWFDYAKPGATSFCMIAPANAASINVAEKLGYASARETTYKGDLQRIYLRPPVVRSVVRYGKI